MSGQAVVSGLRCEYVENNKTCTAPATGYLGGPERQCPLCDLHVQSRFHPPTDRDRLHPNEPNGP